MADPTLVARLELATEKFEKQLSRAYALTAKQTKAIDQSFAKVSAAAGNELAAFGGQIGGVGTVIGALGPAGIAAAAGIGALVAGMTALVGSSNRFAEQAAKFKDLSAQTGLSITQLQALADAGAQFGVTEDKMSTAMVRLAAQMEDFQRAEGDLFKIVNRLDPALAKQIALARSFAEQVDLLAVAFAKAGKAFPALSRAGFGRAGIEIAETLRSISNVGLKQLTEKFKESGDAIDESLVKRVVALKRDIDDMAEDARRNFESIFSERFLNAQKISTERWLEFSRAAKEFSVNPSFEGLGRVFAQIIEHTHPLLVLLNRIAELSNIKFPTVPAAPAAPAPAVAAAPATATARIADTQKELELLAKKNEALAKEQELKLKLGLINRALETTAVQEDVNRLKDEELATEKELTELGRRRADFETEMNKRKVQELGEAATQGEKLKLKEQETEKAVREGNITQAERTRILIANKLAIDAVNVALRTALGIASEEEIIQHKLLLLNQQRALGLKLTAEEAAKAETIIRNEARKTAEEQQVRLSKLPQTMRQAIDFTDVNKQMDQFFTGMSSSFENMIASVVSGTATLKDAFKSMTQAIIADLTRMIVRLTITGPLMRGLAAGFPGLAGGGPVMAGRGYVVGERGPELFVPGRAGTVVPNAVTSRTMAGGGNVMNFYSSIDARGADQAAVVRIERAQQEQDAMFSKRVGNVERTRRIRRVRY